MKSPIEIFSNWVKNGKDEGMEKNHFDPVCKMLNLITKSQRDFSIIDAGCGNGWAVRLISKHPNCILSQGVDGSKEMIEKAKKMDLKNKYFLGDLLKWKPTKKVDAVMSMEVLYYFNNPIDVLKNIFKNWLNPNGKFVMGIDYYYENIACHDWQKKTSVSIMNLMSIYEWEALFKAAGFSNIRMHRFCKSLDWSGTLVIEGIKIEQ